jgi:hypothetical protein
VDSVLEVVAFNQGVSSRLSNHHRHSEMRLTNHHLTGAGVYPLRHPCTDLHLHLVTEYPFVLNSMLGAIGMDIPRMRDSCF